MIVAGVLFSCAREKVAFEDLITTIDSELTLGALKQAEGNIREAASFASGRSEWLTLLKRAYTLGTASNTYETLYIISKKGLSELTGAEEIAALFVFSCLRTGRYEIAYQHAEEYLPSEKWSSIRNEAVLRRNALTGGVLTPPEEGSPLLDAVFTEDPIALARAADLFDDSRFALTAALRFAAEGEIENAAETIAPYSSEYAEPALRMLYDAEKYGDADAIGDIPGSLELDLIRGDIYLRLKDTASAQRVYEEMIESSPEFSWIPYANSSLIFAGQGEIEKAEERIKAGKDLFPGERGLLLCEISVYSETREEKAIRLIEIYKELYPDDPEIAVITAGVIPSDQNRIRLESALWNTFLENPEHSRAVRYLTASLLASGDRDGLSRVLDIWERENGTTAWSFFMRGYQALMDHAGAEAIEAFESSHKISPRWETAFNLGVISQRLGEYDKAIDYFRDAENTIPEKWSGITSTRAMIRAAISRVLYERGDFTGAMREAKYAFDLDPGSNEAALLIDLLEQRLN